MLFTKKSSRMIQRGDRLRPSSKIKPATTLSRTRIQQGTTTRTTTSTKYRHRTALALIIVFLVLTAALFNIYVSSHAVLHKDEKIGADNHPTFVKVKNNHQLSAPTRRYHNACENAEGILHIKMGDIGGAAGTIFFQFVIGQIIYAIKNKLVPWVHFDNTSYIIYDPLQHAKGPGVNLTAMVGRNATRIINYQGHWRDTRPGPLDTAMPVHQEQLHFPGTGVWTDYFEPVSSFVPGDSSCEDKLYVTLDLKLITPGIHGFSKWAPKCWRYPYLPDYITQPHIPVTEWLEPQREFGSRVVKKFIRPKPHIRQMANEANPGCSKDTNPCLGLHIRHSDKAAGRRQVSLHEFLPYVEAFIFSGGQQVYVATDSHKVLEEIRETWPKHVQERLRALPNIVRSSDEQAVFEIESHHRVNTEILVEIYALANCQYMVHGFSAVSESAIWLNYKLHAGGVNLEDPERLNAAEFGTLVKMDLGNFESHMLPTTYRTEKWWDINEVQPGGNDTAGPVAILNTGDCDRLKGFLIIQETGEASSVSKAFFMSILNQLVYAERQNLFPVFHLLPTKNKDLYESSVHGKVQNKIEIEVWKLSGEFNEATSSSTVELGALSGKGVWGTYFKSSASLHDISVCPTQKVFTLDESVISPSALVLQNWTLKAWQYDNVPKEEWNPGYLPMNNFLRRDREKASDIVKKYMNVASYIQERANEINPFSSNCLSVHLRNGNKNGKNRKKMRADVFLPYMKAFIEAGGEKIFVASDSHRPLQYIKENFPPDIVSRIQTAGPYVARTFKEWPSSMLDKPHRIVSEVLADILALSKCDVLLHGYSTTSEAAIYFNTKLFNNSVNLEDPLVDPIDAFAQKVKLLIGDSHTVGHLFVPERDSTIEPTIIPMNGTTIVHHELGSRLENAIVFLAQKEHRTYMRESYGNFLEALRLVRKNYLSIDDHFRRTDVIIFHTGDFNSTDLLEIELILGEGSFGRVKLVDLSGSRYWARPDHLKGDDSSTWKVIDLFPESYRHMIRWFAIGIWTFFNQLESELGWKYRYILRLDEDSYIRSPIKYDIFDFMKSNQYAYGFRMCSYEMKVNWRMWNMWNRTSKDFRPIRDQNEDLCGFYNNFFVADIKFFLQEKVQYFLRFIDQRGHIYRRRLGDLNIHSMAVYAYARPEQIHRFLDFSYEHKTILNKTDGCITWGGIQAGYKDKNSSSLLLEYYNRHIIKQDCSLHVSPKNPAEKFYQASFLRATDLSPSYQHLSPQQTKYVHLHTITSGDVELARKGIMSG